MNGGRPHSRVWSLVAVVGGVAALAGVGLAGWLLLAWSGDAAEPVAEAPVTDMDLRGRVAVTSPVVARDPTEPEFVVAATRGDSPGPGCGLQVSGDGGDSWVQIDVVGTLPGNLGGCYQPQVAFEADGRLVYTFVGMIGPPPEPDGVFVVTSADRAQTFTQPRRITETPTNTARMAASTAGIEMVWLDPVEEADWGQSGPPWPVGPQVLAAVGDPGGLGEPMVVAEPEGLVAAPTIAGDPNGAAAVAYYELPKAARVDGGVESLADEGPWRLMVARRTEDGTGGFEEPVQVAELEWSDQAVWSSDLRAPEDAPDALQPLLLTRWGIAEPGLAVRDGQVCASWTDGADGGLQAMLSCATDKGGWSSPARLGASTEAAQMSWLPQVAINPAGQAQAVFYGRGDDGEAADAWFASTDEPAEDVTDVARLTSRPSSPQTSPRPGWYGSRLGLTSGTDAAVAMWADTRNSSQVQPNQTLFSAVVDSPSGPPSSLWWVTSGLLAGGLIVAAGGLVARLRPRRTDGSQPSDIAASSTEEVHQ